ncbi:winged helix-turn-helix domain-containing protein [Nonomuraea sp. NPDC050691]|uniref:winged helix-turn-helix domain-containing protein n=1 Tax=Nonomuraea sp. NPDC050691 TaxID=3155661 RepID=UPI0033E46B7E
MLRDVIGDTRSGVPASWRDAVRGALPAGAALVRPLLSTRDCWMPDSLALTADLRTTSMGTVLRELGGLDPQALADEVSSHYRTSMPPAWQRFVDDPGAFLTAYRQVLRAAWAVMEPLWARADSLFARETERIGAAVVSRGLDAVLSGLSTPLRYVDGTLHLPHPPCRRPPSELGGRRLVLVPLASGFSASMYDVERDDLVWIGYPLPGLGRIVTRTHPAAPTAPDSALTRILGPIRAAILRASSPQPSVSELARHLHLGVSTITYHCDQLTAAGLLHRERRGREVRLRLTHRGTEILDLFAGPSEAGNFRR